MAKPNFQHPFIRDLRRGPTAEHFKEVAETPFGSHHCWSKREFRRLHCYEQLSAAVANTAWRRLLQLCEKVYYEPVWEFYTTFKHNTTDNWQDGTAVQFRLGGVPRSLSYHELAEALDLDLDDREDYVTEVNEPPEVDFGRLYTSLARPGQTRPFRSGRTKASTLQIDNRLLHHLLAKSYTPAADSAGAITKRSLYFLHSIRQRRHPLHLGSVVAKTFEKTATELKSLHCAPLITRLATFFGLSLQGCTEEGDTLIFGRTTIRKMLLLRERNGVQWVDGFQEPPIPAEPVPEEEEAADEVDPEEVDAAADADDNPPQTDFHFGGSSSAFQGQDYFAQQFEQLRIQNQLLLDHQMQFHQQYAADQAEYRTRMDAYAERLNTISTQQGVTLAHIEREKRRSRRMQEVQQHLLQLLPGEPPVWRTPWDDSPPHDGATGAADDDAFMNDIDLDDLGDE
ncbi:unnamed protein product [Linum trigynum]|uniref:Uncharacterized protein n=1 Tax=Linum trigynum TaxID=586398 RepID=A0AAV2EQI0_9ROSI